MIDYRDLFPPSPPPMYGVSQPLYMKVDKDKIWCKLSIPGDEKELCMLDPIAADLHRRFAEIGLEIEQPGVSLLLDTLNYTVRLQGGFNREKPTFLGEIKLPMGYPELIKQTMNHRQLECDPFIQIMLSGQKGDLVFQVIKDTLFPNHVLKLIKDLKPWLHCIDWYENRIYLAHFLFDSDFNYWWSFHKSIQLTSELLLFQDENAEGLQEIRYSDPEQLKKDFVKSLFCDCSLCIKFAVQLACFQQKQS